MPRRNKKSKSRRTEISCKTATTVVTDYVEGSLGPDVKLAFEQHLQACPDCVAFLNTYKKTVQLARSFLSRDFREPNLARVRKSLSRKLQTDRP
jgi:anti-sigma factor RsiW